MSEWLLDDVAAYAEGQNPVGEMIPQVSSTPRSFARYLDR